MNMTLRENLFTTISAIGPVFGLAVWISDDFVYWVLSSQNPDVLFIVWEVSLALSAIGLFFVRAKIRFFMLSLAFLGAIFYGLIMFSSPV